MLGKWFVDYKKEEEGYDTYVSTYGFCCYKITDDGFFCADLFVGREQRGNGIAFGKELEDFARKHGCNHMIGNVFIGNDDERFIRKLRLFNRLGFKILKQDNNCTQLIKEI